MSEGMVQLKDYLISDVVLPVMINLPLSTFVM